MRRFFYGGAGGGGREGESCLTCETHPFNSFPNGKLFTDKRRNVALRFEHYMTNYDKAGIFILNSRSWRHMFEVTYTQLIRSRERKQIGCHDTEDWSDVELQCHCGSHIAQCELSTTMDIRRRHVTDTRLMYRTRQYATLHIKTNVLSCSLSFSMNRICVVSGQEYQLARIPSVTPGYNTHISYIPVFRKLRFARICWELLIELRSGQLLPGLLLGVNNKNSLQITKQVSPTLYIVTEIARFSCTFFICEKLDWK